MWPVYQAALDSGQLRLAYRQATNGGHWPSGATAPGKGVTPGKSLKMEVVPADPSTADVGVHVRGLNLAEYSDFNIAGEFTSPEAGGELESDQPLLPQRCSGIASNRIDRGRIVEPLIGAITVDDGDYGLPESRAGGNGKDSDQGERKKCGVELGVTVFALHHLPLGFVLAVLLGSFTCLAFARGNSRFLNGLSGGSAGRELVFWRPRPAPSAILLRLFIPVTQSNDLLPSGLILITETSMYSSGNSTITVPSAKYVVLSPSVGRS